MIAFTHGSRLLDRFVDELDTQSPIPSLEVRADLRGASEEELEAARTTWAVRVLDEHRSVAVFSELLRLLARAEAPFPCLCAVQKLIGDELRHVKLCAEALAALDPDGRVTVDLRDVGLPPDGGGHAAARAYEIVARELVVGETESVAMLRVYRDACQDPDLKRALDVLFRDEVRHAAVGRALLRVLAGTLPREPLAELGRRLPSTVIGDVDHIRAVYRAAAKGGPGRRYGASITREELPAGPDYGGVEALFRPVA